MREEKRQARVVIVGAGFGGLNAARALRNAPVEITIVDRHNYHCFQPLLYQVATATLSPADIAWPIRTLVRDQKNVTVLLAAVTGADVKSKLVFADGRAFPFDYLILAPGATHSYFGHPEWAQVAPGLKTIEDATAIRRATLLAFEKAELAQTDQERKRYLSFVIVGGGPTGVEMAGAIAAIAREVAAAGLQADQRQGCGDPPHRGWTADFARVAAKAIRLRQESAGTHWRAGRNLDRGHGMHRERGPNGEGLHRGGDDYLGRRSGRIPSRGMARRAGG